MLVGRLRCGEGFGGGCDGKLGEQSQDRVAVRPVAASDLLEEFSGRRRFR
jgi:hypothetical protein